MGSLGYFGNAILDAPYGTRITPRDGWFAGSFFPTDDPRYDPQVSLRLSFLPRGAGREGMTREADTNAMWYAVFRGVLENMFQFPGRDEERVVLYRPRDCALIQSGHRHRWMVREECLVFMARWETSEKKDQLIWTGNIDTITRDGMSSLMVGKSVFPSMHPCCTDAIQINAGKFLKGTEFSLGVHEGQSRKVVLLVSGSVEVILSTAEGRCIYVLSQEADYHLLSDAGMVRTVSVLEDAYLIMVAW